MTDKTGLIIDMGGFPAEGISEFRLSADISIPKSYCDEEKASVTVVGKLKRNTEDVFTFEGSVQAELMLKCDLCLDNFLKRLEFPFEGIFERNSGSEENYSFSGDKIDLEEAVYTELLLNFPMKNVCREDCKGLCIKCGANLNYGDCGCDTFEGSEAFLKLKEMFNEE